MSAARLHHQPDAYHDVTAEVDERVFMTSKRKFLPR